MSQQIVGQSVVIEKIGNHLDLFTLVSAATKNFVASIPRPHWLPSRKNEIWICFTRIQMLFYLENLLPGDPISCGRKAKQISNVKQNKNDCNSYKAYKLMALLMKLNHL